MRDGGGGGEAQDTPRHWLDDVIAVAGLKGSEMMTVRGHDEMCLALSWKQ